MMACSYPIVLIKAIPVPHLLPVPCNRCAACRKDKIQMWADRLTFEDLTSSLGSTMLTLTFDDAHMPKNRSADIRHMTNFFKRLRYYHSKRDLPPFRYFYTSEYGETGTYRLHYHVILTNYDSGAVSSVEDVASAWADKYGNRLGIVQLGAVRAGGIRYVTEYMSYENPAYTKVYQALGFSPLVHNMSKGIGKNWILSHADEIRRSDGYYSNGVLRPLPRYWQEQLGMVVKYDYLNRLDDIWQKYNDILKIKHYEPVDPLNPDAFKERHFADMVSRDDRRSCFQKIVGDDGKELRLAGDFLFKSQADYSPSLGFNTVYAV